jgi:hypothetical protein
MGAGSSVPETLTKDQAMELAGDKWDEAAFDATAADGVITAEQFSAAAAAGSAAAAAAAAAARALAAVQGL